MQEVRAGYGKRKKKKNKGMNLDKRNVMSLLYDAEPVDCVRAAAAEAPVAPPLVAVSAPPPARPTLRVADCEGGGFTPEPHAGTSTAEARGGAE